LKLILNKEIQNQRLSLIKDLFIFSCFTGFAYADYQKLSKDDISIDGKGRRWIVIPRTKSKTPSKVPLLPFSEAIIEKYHNHPGCLKNGTLLPVVSNQKLNSYLKELADTVGISKKLTTHTGRRTFSSVANHYDVPATTITKVIGHKNFKHLHLYAKVHDEKIVKDMDIITKAFENIKSPIAESENVYPHSDNFQKSNQY
jgi:site-specific recombinase XerD